MLIYYKQKESLMMIIKLPQVDTPINLGAPPDNLEDIVCESFSKYTAGTNKDFTFYDKLAYIDVLRKKLHPKASNEIVYDKFHEYFDYCLDNGAELPSYEDYWDEEFFNECVEAGDKPLYTHYGDSCGEEETILLSIVRIIKTVINWGDNNSTIIRTVSDNNE